MDELREHVPARVPEPHRRDRSCSGRSRASRSARSWTSSWSTWTKRLAERKLRLELTPAAQARLADEGYDPVYGARPLKRVIQQRLQNPLALRLLQGEFVAGDTVMVDVSGDGYAFRKA